MTSLRWTSRDLEILPDDGKRYEIVDGELYVSKQPHWHHQFVCNRIWELLQTWSRQTKAGMANSAPGLIFDDDDDVAPDVVWISRERMAKSLQPERLEVYRREDAALKLYSTLYENDLLQSPLLPGFSFQVSQLFDEIS